MSNDRDLTSTLTWTRSLRASQARRSAAERMRRWSRRRRTTAVALSLGLAAFGGVAVAAPGGETSSGDRPAATQGTTGVRTAQSKLGVTVDGIVGPQTRRAVRAFQRRNGLTVDGIIGPRTLSALGVDRSSSAGDGSSSNAGGSSDGASAKGSSASAPSGQLARIAQCESGGDPTAVSSDGTYRGKYQFDRQTWQANGGSGDPAAASEAEQDRIAQRLLEARGTQPWPVCGR
ncbi:MAG: transglycosylase family protein [Solirubrobacteraceae bacterium]